MAFSFTKEGSTVAGAKVFAWGTYANATSVDTGGDILTGLAKIEGFWLNPRKNAVITDSSVVNETLPLLTDGVTIKTQAEENGYWFAFGI